MKAVVAKTAMLIRKPAEQVYAAFVDPAITTQFWFTGASGALEQGKSVQWNWSMYGASADVQVLTLVPGERIVIEWPGAGTRNTVVWSFASRDGGNTLVSIEESGFDPADPELVDKVADSTGGFSLVLAGAKAYLEHGLRLKLVEDRFPDGPPC